jgi:putative endonuclease
MGSNHAVVYFLYIVKCVDGTFYTGITSDLERRVHEHNTSVRAAKYTQKRRPVLLVYFTQFPNRAVATSAEYKVKRLSRTEKTKLIDHDILITDVL